MRRVIMLLALVALLAPSTARADRYEATLSGAASAGLARVGQASDGGDLTTTAPAVGASLRVAHAWRDRLAWDLQLGGTLTMPATFEDVTRIINTRPEQGDVTRRTVTAAFQLGAELRFGTRWIPTVRLGLGPQLRHQSASDLGTIADAIPAATSLDVMASVGVGVDVRLGRHLLVGLALQLDHTQGVTGDGALDVIGLTARVSRAWYPRVWAPEW